MNIEEYIKVSQKEKLEKLKNENNKQDISFERNTETGKLLQRIKERISEERQIDIKNDEESKELLKHTIEQYIEEESEKDFSYLMLGAYEKSELANMLFQNMVGYGVIDHLINDKDVTEIMINGPKTIFIEKAGKLQEAVDKRGEKIQFASGEELKNIVDKIVSPLNRKVDESNPIVDGRLPNGSRVNIVLNPISLDGTAVTIRKFPENPYTMKQLVAFGSLSDNVSAFLERLVKAKYNIIVSGGTGTGKTTFLNALSMFIPEEERVVTVEDAAELNFSQVKNIVRLETRPANLEGNGAITIRDLVRSALRMRPDRIIVGEVRTGEALDMLQAMNTGHDGSLSTIHANSAKDVLMRLETMVLMSGMQLPVISIRQQIASAIDFIIHIGRLRDRSRKMVTLTEIVGIDGEEIITRNICEFEETGTQGEKDALKIIGTFNVRHKEISRPNKFITSGIEDYQKFLDWK